MTQIPFAGCAPEELLMDADMQVLWDNKTAPVHTVEATTGTALRVEDYLTIYFKHRLNYERGWTEAELYAKLLGVHL